MSKLWLLAQQESVEKEDIEMKWGWESGVNSISGVKRSERKG